MSKVYLGLGSNLGDKRENIKKAVAFIAKRVGGILTLSGFYETKPWGYDSSETYLNAAVGIDTPLSPEELLLITQDIEREMGRWEKSIDGKFHDRIIDIDILLYDYLILQTKELTIPHSLMHKREFVLRPLSEIAPDIVHPVLNMTMTNLLTKFHS